MGGFGTFGPVVEPKSVTRERPERGGRGHGLMSPFAYFETFCYAVVNVR